MDPIHRKFYNKIESDVVSPQCTEVYGLHIRRAMAKGDGSLPTVSQILSGCRTIRNRCGLESSRGWPHNRWRRVQRRQSGGRLGGRRLGGGYQVWGSAPAAMLESIVQCTCRLVSLKIVEGDHPGFLDLNPCSWRIVFGTASLRATHRVTWMGAVGDFVQPYKFVSIFSWFACQAFTCLNSHLHQVG
jgi:hypothetical protein